MTYVPIIIPPQTDPPDTDYRDLLTAIKLLSGEECIRDVRQAQTLLVGLTESEHDPIATDARSIMRTGLKEGWFEDRAPKYYTLRTMVQRSDEAHQRRSNKQQQALVIGLGLGMVMLGLVAFFVVSGTDTGTTNLPIIAAIAVLAVMGALVAIKKNRSST